MLMYPYIIVIDFEATCDEKKPDPQEIIEFPAVLVDTQTLTAIDEMQFYCKPQIYPELSKFCTTLTGITQGIVDNGVSFDDAIYGFDDWLRKDRDGIHLFDENYYPKFLIVTCGDWDLKTMLPEQMSILGLQIPEYLKSWCNIKIPFEKKTGFKRGGMDYMLEKCGLILTGRHHSGIDDCRNIAKIVIYLLQKGAILDITGKTN